VRDLRAFVARCRASFPDFMDARYNDVLKRYEIITLSAANRPVSQFYGWFRNPLTGKAIEPDPVTGLVPFRELDETAQEEVFKSLEQTFLGNPLDGAGSHRASQQRAREYNAALVQKRRKERAETIVGVLKEMTIARPWVKYHPHAKDPRARRLTSAHVSK
jgi:hypothetical protein